MRKLLLSLAVIVAVGGAVAASTGAFFSDTETSTGNTFTAGSIDLTVDSTQHYNNAVCVLDSDGHGTWQLAPSANATIPQYPVIGDSCYGTWVPANLGAQKFFNFPDVKPGDSGEDTVSLHVGTNDAYACVDVAITKNDDVSSVQPELTAGDVANTDSIFDGELAQNLNFFAWVDNGAGTQGAIPGDNIWQAGEPPLFTNNIGPASDVLGGKSYTLANSQTGPLVASTTNYIGLAWCAGTLTTPTPGTIHCDGAGMGNIAQTDSMVASIAFRVVQSRNNSDFVCGNVAPQPGVTHSLRLENETIVADGPWTIINDGTHGYLAWTGDANEFNYTFSAQGLTPSTNYDLIYYADGWPGNNPGAFIGTFTTDGAGAIASTTANPNLNTDLPELPDGNFAVGAKIWLVRTSDYNNGTLATGPMTAWNPSQYLFEGNVYIHYDDTNHL